MGLRSRGLSSDSALASLVGQTVSVVLNGNTYTGAVGSDGSWSVNVGATDLAALTNGKTYTVTASVTDLAGNKASSTDRVVVTTSLTSPTVTITAAGGLTNQANQTISGSVASGGATLGATVTLYDNGAQIGTAPVTNGSWSTGITLAGDGSHSIVAKDTDAAGNTGSSTPVVFTLDTVASTVTIGTSGGLTNQASQTISGTVLSTEAAPGATVTLYDNGVQIGAAPVTNGDWSAGITLAGDGSHSIVAKDTDAAGNTGSSTPAVFTLDTLAPAVTEALADDTGSSSSDEITSDPSLSGSGDSDATVHFTVDGAPMVTTVTADGAGHWTFMPSGLADGSHTIVASETDAAGNTGSASLTFTLDTTANATIGPLTSDDVLNASEANAGFVVGGSTNADRI